MRITASRGGAFVHLRRLTLGVVAFAAALSASPTRAEEPPVFQAPPNPVAVAAPRFERLESGALRLSLRFTEETPFHLFDIPGEGALPERLVLDVAQVSWDFPDQTLDPGVAAEATRIRSALFRPGQSRLVLELRGEPVVLRRGFRPGGAGGETVFEIDFGVRGVSPLKLNLDAPVESAWRPRPRRFRVAALDASAAPEAAAKPRALRQPAVREMRTLASFSMPDPLSAFSAPLRAPKPLASLKRRSRGSEMAPRQELFRPARPARSALGAGPSSDNELVLVCDAGHGGGQPGAQLGGVVEKDVVLRVCLRVREIFRRVEGVRVALTRDRDVNVGLAERERIAKREDGDLFISVHVNSFPADSAVRGAGVYTLDSGFANRIARKLAERDRLAGVTLSGENRLVRTIMADQIQNHMTENSKILAELLIGEFRRFKLPLERKNQHRTRSNLHVLKIFDMPSVLIELAYVTNAADRANMRDDAWTDNAAQAIARAVIAWRTGDFGGLRAAHMQQ